MFESKLHKIIVRVRFRGVPVALLFIRTRTLITLDSW